MTREARVLISCGLVWGLVTSLPHAMAAALPPAGRWFTGFLFFQDDFFQYLSFAEQAARGHVLFENKFALFAHDPFLFNPEWWLAGILSVPFGGNPAAGFHVLGLLSAAALWLAAGRLLADGGGGGQGLAWRVCLFATGGGLGVWRALRGVPFSRIPDLGMCVAPWSQAVYGSAHAILSTALLLSSLMWLVRWLSAGAKRWPWIAAASALALVRPFDALLFGCVAAVLIALQPGTLPERAQRPAELLWLLPVALYDLLAFGFHPAFATWTSSQNAVVSPPLKEMLFAFGPALALALPTLRGPKDALVPRAVRRALWLVVASISLALPSGLSFALQFANSLGAALLLLAALALPRRIVPAAVLVMAPSSCALLWVLLNPAPQWFAPNDYLVMTREIRARASPGDRVMAPVDLGLLVAAYTPCRVVVGHRVVTPDYAERSSEAVSFYDPATTEHWRLAYLKAVDARWLAMPSSPQPWVHDGSFAIAARAPGWELWQRRLAPSPFTP